MPTLRSGPRLVIHLIFIFALFPLIACAAPIPPAIDYSSVGFNGDGSPPPIVPVSLLVHPTGGDDTALLQAALDHAASLPIQPNGFRAAVLLSPGTFSVSGQLLMPATGVVLRGSPD